MRRSVTYLLTDVRSAHLREVADLERAVSVLALVPQYLLGEVGLDEATDEEREHQAKLREAMRIARLYARRDAIERVAIDDVIYGLSEGLA